MTIKQNLKTYYPNGYKTYTLLHVKLLDIKDGYARVIPVDAKEDEKNVQEFKEEEFFDEYEELVK